MSFCFLLCDIQSSFSKHIHQYPRIVKTAQKLLAASRILEQPLIVTEQYPERLGQTDNTLDISGAVIVEPKMRFSMITPKIKSYLAEQKIQKCIVFGIEAHVCVTQTCLDLRKEGIETFVVADGVSSINKQEIGIALQRLASIGCHVTTSESLLFQMVEDAKHPKFKQISQLIKETKQETQTTLESLFPSL
ncbi:Isochorismatase-like protein [Gorgonomyces haynaldii]|nr:Isochorismatase-like protein [Gorgonomyces haynaldii]